MKTLFVCALTFFASISHAEDEKGQACLFIPLRGLETDKIEKVCKTGDIILLDRKHMPYYCDFKYAIVNYDFKDKYACVFRGNRRELRDGANP